MIFLIRKGKQAKAIISLLESFSLIDICYVLSIN